MEDDIWELEAEIQRLKERGVYEKLDFSDLERILDCIVNCIKNTRR